MSETSITTPFSLIYDKFLSKITDDMYMELNELDTYALLQRLLVSAIHWFEFPKVDINNYEITEISEVGTYNGIESNNEDADLIIYNSGYFNVSLTEEEQNIIATYMVVEWVGQQLASVENTRMKYSGSDFKFTSQANHLSKLVTLKKEYEAEGFHLQRLYKRRDLKKDGGWHSTLDIIMSPLPRKG